MAAPGSSLFGDSPQAADRFFSTLRERLYRYFASRVGEQKADDLAQEAITRLIGKFDGLQDEEEAIRVAFGIARFVVMESRRPAHETQPPEEDAGWDSDRSFGAHETERRLLMDRILAMLPALGDDCRRTIEMFLQDKSSDDMQRVLRIRSRATVYVRVHRCIKKLAELVGTAPEGGT